MLTPVGFGVIVSKIGRGVYGHGIVMKWTVVRDIEEAKGGGDHHAEITCDDRLSMMAHKRLPALGGPAMPSTVVHTLGPVLADGPRRHTQTQLEQELVGNTFPSPGRILSRHTTEKGLQVRRNG